jgi:anaerobic magnesium-protoporphyrin IX monomethyl ester cyclase
MGKILLISPYGFVSNYAKNPNLDIVAAPMGLAYVASVLEQSGHKVSVLDCLAERSDRRDVELCVSNEKPDFVGIQAFTPSVHYAIEMAETVKGIDHEIKVIFGGTHATVLPEATFGMSDSVDFIVRHEGEYAFLNLINALEKGADYGSLKEIKGISFRAEGKIVNTPNAPLVMDLDEIPFPALHLFPVDEYKYFGSKKEIYSLISSRGCPYSCAFCASSIIKKWRGRSAKNIVDEMEYARERFGYKGFAFMDDLAAFKRDRIFDICNEMRERNLDFAWGITARVDNLDREMLTQMKDTNCRLVFLGVESGSQEILDGMKKEITLEQIRKAFKWTNELKMDSIASVTLGFPGETRESIEQTAKFVIKLDPGVLVISAATPYPGTPYFQKTMEEGLLPRDLSKIDWRDFTMYDAVIGNENLTREEVDKLISEFYNRFRKRPRWIFKRLALDIRQNRALYGNLKGLPPFKQPLTVRLLARWIFRKSWKKTFAPESEKQHND